MKQSKLAFFENIISTGDFDKLNAFIDPRTWISLSHEEKIRMGEAFALQANRIKDDENLSLETILKYAKLFLELSCETELIDCVETAIIFYKKIQIESMDKEIQHEVCSGLGLCYVFLFKCFYKSEHLDAVSHFYTKATTLKPEDATIWYYWGSILFLAARVLENEDYLRAAIEKLAVIRNEGIGNAEALYVGALALSGFIEENPDQFTIAEKIVQRALEKTPTDPVLLFAYAEICYYRGMYFEEESSFVQGLEKVERGLKLDKNLGGLWHIRGRLQHCLAERRDDRALTIEALSSFKAAAASSVADLGYFWFEWGLACYCLVRGPQDLLYVREAKEKFEHAIESHEEVIMPEWLYFYAETLDSLAILEEKFEYHQEAAQALEVAIAIYPEYIQAFTSLGSTYQHIAGWTSDPAYYEKALLCYQEAAKLDPEDYFNYSEWGHTLINYAAFLEDDGENIEPHVLTKIDALRLEAEQQLLTSYSLGGAMQATYHLACLYSMKGNISDAVSYFQKAVDMGYLPAMDQVEKDPWLENLSKTQYFQNLKKSYSPSPPKR